ncbi:hypothetical protein ABZ079_29195 [Streptomyces sp. NPDC006314]|uniref:hypothetical protein n=1 Tax=Streptomyces sp. NPDC006314 TaxID=3154475 RepID=UPI0033A1F7A6
MIAAKTWKASRPPGVVVSKRSCSEQKPISRRRSSGNGPGGRARERGDDQDVAGGKEGVARLQFAAEVVLA